MKIYFSILKEVFSNFKTRVTFCGDLFLIRGVLLGDKCKIPGLNLSDGKLLITSMLFHAHVFGLSRRVLFIQLLLRYMNIAP